MRVVIMAAGDGHRWKNYLNGPKQLAPVDGVPLLHRTLELLGKAGISEIYVTVRQVGAFGELQGAKEYLPKDSEFEIDRIWGVRDLATQPTLFIYGDAYYTPEAMKLLVTPRTDGFHFYGRSGPSGPKPFWEAFWRHGG